MSGIKMIKLSTILPLLLLTLLVARADKFNNSITINSTALRIEVAETETERAIGLMYRDSMPKDCGMLFIFPQEDLLSFWMKNTYIPLSIAFVDVTGLIIDIQDMEPLSLDSVISNGFALYALEVNQGWFRQNNIKVGDRIQF